MLKDKFIKKRFGHFCKLLFLPLNSVIFSPDTKTTLYFCSLRGWWRQFVKAFNTNDWYFIWRRRPAFFTVRCLKRKLFMSLPFKFSFILVEPWSKHARDRLVNVSSREGYSFYNLSFILKDSTEMLKVLIVFKMKVMFFSGLRLLLCYLLLLKLLLLDSE